MSPQRILAATLAWLAVVASVSALVWVVISRAGDDLVSSDQPLTTTGEPRATNPPGATGRPSRTPSSGATSATASPTTAPTSPTEEPSGGAIEQRRTWQGQVGSVVAACGATGIRLVSAEPADGFRAEVKDEDGGLEVEFEGREDRVGTDVKVAARCVDGVPSFSVESDD